MSAASKALGELLRDLERREREGLPPWIRLVGGGGDAA